MINVFKQIEAKKEKPKNNPFNRINRVATEAKISNVGQAIKNLKGDLEAIKTALSEVKK